MAEGFDRRDVTHRVNNRLSLGRSYPPDAVVISMSCSLYAVTRVVHDISAMFRSSGEIAMDRTTEMLSAFVCDLQHHDLTPRQSIR
jgi:hypothetical protein